MFNPFNLLSPETWALLVTICALIWYYFHHNFQYLKKLGIPHETPSILQFGNSTKLFKETFTVDNDMKKKFGPVWGFYFGAEPTIMIHDPDILRQIFIKDFPSFPVRQNRLIEINGPELSKGITVVEGEAWKRIRSAITPTFSTTKIKDMTEIIDWCAGNAVESLKRKNQNADGTFDPKEVFSRLSLDIVCSAAFSTKVHSQDETQKDPEIVIHSKKIFGTSFFGLLFFLCFIFPFMEKFFVKLGVYLMPRDSRMFFRGLVQHIIKERDDNKGAERRVDLLQLMLDAKISEKEVKSDSKGMTETEIVGNSILMILAGYENTSNTMWMLAYNFAMHPEIQTQVQEEIDEMMKTHGRFDYDGVNSLKFFDMCLNESLRLYSPIIRNARICTKEVTINGVTFPKGMNVGIPVYALSHDPDYWDEPYKFKPERMSDLSQIDPMVYQPFGAGPRNCIGMRFALMEVKLSLCKILYHFTLKPAENTPAPPVQMKFAPSLSPKEKFNLKAVPRKL